MGYALPVLLSNSASRRNSIGVRWIQLPSPRWINRAAESTSRRKSETIGSAQGAGGVPSQRDTQTRLQFANAEWLAQVIIARRQARQSYRFLRCGRKGQSPVLRSLTRVTNKSIPSPSGSEIENNNESGFRVAASVNTL
ncbi:hypothetical protein KCP75_02500 [Salmonella enterica subsp. enterica]|nr:hypothetical protein KCP75_02500 [Salmonella enterica subsp. enterica]